MANNCSFLMTVRGKRKSINLFEAILDKKKRYFDRVYDWANIDEYENEDGTWSRVYEGDCAWSVGGCMFKAKDPNYPNLTSVPEESKHLGLDIEIYSEECGFCFQEHYLVKHGEVIEDECIDWVCHSAEDFETKEEAEKILGREISDYEWEHNENLDVGGYDEWEFSI